MNGNSSRKSWVERRTVKILQNLRESEERWIYEFFFYCYFSAKKLIAKGSESPRFFLVPKKIIIPLITENLKDRELRGNFKSYSSSSSLVIVLDVVSARVSWPSLVAALFTWPVSATFSWYLREARVNREQHFFPHSAALVILVDPLDYTYTSHFRSAIASWNFSMIFLLNWRRILKYLIAPKQLCCFPDVRGD